MPCIKWGPDVSQVAGTHTPETCPLRKVTADAALTGPAEPGRGQPAHQHSCPERSLELEGVLTCSAYQAPFSRRPWRTSDPRAGLCVRPLGSCGLALSGGAVGGRHAVLAAVS